MSQRGQNTGKIFTNSFSQNPNQETPGHFRERRRGFKWLRNEMLYSGNTKGSGFSESWEERIKEMILEARLQQNNRTLSYHRDMKISFEMLHPDAKF
jgi:hypothetical protein